MKISEEEFNANVMPIKRSNPTLYRDITSRMERLDEGYNVPKRLYNRARGIVNPIHEDTVIEDTVIEDTVIEDTVIKGTVIDNIVS